MARYEEIAADLRQSMNRGEYPPGSTLPGYAKLTQKYATGRATITQALRLLETEGWVQPIKRSGLVVRDRRSRRLARHTSAHFPAHADEKWTSHEVAESWESAPADVAEALAIEQGAPALRQRRVMSPEGEPPWCVADIWVPQQVATQADSDGGPKSWSGRAWPAMPDRESARLLHISQHMPVMIITRIGVYASTDEPVQFEHYTVPGDRIEL